MRFVRTPMPSEIVGQRQKRQSFEVGAALLVGSVALTGVILFLISATVGLPHDDGERKILELVTLLTSWMVLFLAGSVVVSWVRRLRSRNRPA